MRVAMNYKKGYAIYWSIENYSFCWHKPDEALLSPSFTVDGLGQTAWYLCLYPFGNYLEKDRIIIDLRRKENKGPEKVTIMCDLSIIAEGGSSFYLKQCEYNFYENFGRGSVFAETSKIPSKLLAEYLPVDILTVRCKFSIGKGNAETVETIFARTRIGVANVSFLHVVDFFSALEANCKKTYRIYSHTQKGWLESQLYISDDFTNEGRVVVKITPSNSHRILVKCELYLVDSSGNKMKCAEADNRFDVNRKEIRKLHLSLTKDEIMSKKSEYLFDDKLSLLCKCFFPTGIEFEKIEGVKDSTTIEKLLVRNPRMRDSKIFAEKLSACPSALDDLKGIYKDSFLTDVVLKTKLNSFPAHKVVLSARSPVFKVMLSNDMKEKNCGCIEMDDLEDETVKHLLQFLYSDHLDNLQWETATKLYYVADRYHIEKLRLICTSFLIDNLSVSTSTELLLLADTHNDLDLKKYVEDFILDHDEIVFVSDEWQMLIERNHQLALRTMQLKYKTGKRR